MIYTHPKIGKTSALVQLPNSLLIDLENGSSFVKGRKINVVKKLLEENTKRRKEGEKELSKIDYLKALIRKLRESDHKYDYIIVDTTTALEEIAKEMGAEMYRATQMGKSWKGSDIYTLPQGSGYGYARNAFEIIYNAIAPLANKGLILAAHTKAGSITKNGESLSARDINLTGRLKLIVCSDMDAIGFMYREKSSNKNILSFKSSETDLATGARPEHLRQKEIVISELKEDGSLQTNWDKIFLDLKKSK